MVATSQKRNLIVLERRLIDESYGGNAWFVLWEKLPFSESDDLTLERANILQPKVIAALRGLETKEYASFCFRANKYFGSKEKQQTPFFSDFPNQANFQEKYKGESEKLAKKIVQERVLENRVPLIMGAAGLAVGAIAGGALIGSEYTLRVTESMPALAHYSERIASAVGGISGGLLGWLGSGALLKRYEQSIRNHQSAIEQKVDLEFTATVQRYVQDHE